ncbi:MAG: carbonic anhydrase family protein [Haliangiales bacterium]
MNLILPRTTSKGLGMLSLATLLVASGCALDADSSAAMDSSFISDVQSSPVSYEAASTDICETGQEQSPIALNSLLSLPLNLTPPSFSYNATPLSMRNTGKTIEFAYEPGSYASDGGVNYSLAQFHFHTPSEHTIDGNSFPLEMHLVHTDSNGNPALVVGVMIEEGATNQALATAFSNLPDETDEVIAPTGATIDASDLLPGNTTMFSYNGSLTTPPCTEGLDWHVMKHPIEMSSAQISAYQSISGLSASNRATQPINSRTVLKHIDLL